MTNNKSLFVLPFDHRASFRKMFLGIEGREATAEELETLKDLKRLIFEGFKLAVAQNLPPKDQAAILVDEQQGDSILREAVADGYVVAVSVEKSGQEWLSLEYRDQFEEHVNKYKPAIVKILLQYNPAKDSAKNLEQCLVLKRVDDFTKKAGYKYMVEHLIPATPEQLASVGGDQKKFEDEMRPGLVVETIAQMQEAGIDPDIWKLEGMSDPKHYEMIVKQARSKGNNDVGIIVLGRGLNEQELLKWLKAGSKVPGVIGFAVGRTIFSEPLKDFVAARISREQAVIQIRENYQKFYKAFVDAK